MLNSFEGSSLTFEDVSNYQIVKRIIDNFKKNPFFKDEEEEEEGNKTEQKNINRICKRNPSNYYIKIFIY